MRADAAGVPDVAGAGPAVTFDLSAEQARQSRAGLRTYGAYGAGAIAIGLFALLGAISVPSGTASQVLLGLVAVLFIALPSAALYFTVVGGLTAIGLSDAGLTVSRTHRPPLTVAWSDPKLGIVITELTVPPATFFPRADPRAVQPQWIFVAPPVRNGTTVPAELARALARYAEARGVPVERAPALIYGVSSPRSPGVTPAARRIPPRDPTVPNGRLTLIGPAAHAN